MTATRVSFDRPGRPPVTGQIIAIRRSIAGHDVVEWIDDFDGVELLHRVDDPRITLH